MASTLRSIVLVPAAFALCACAASGPTPPPLTAPRASASAAPTVRHAVGDRCPGQQAVECVDPMSALLCQHDVLVRTPCRGLTGCQGAGAAAKCDDDVMEEGDACAEGVAVDNLGCSVDGQKENICDHGVARTLRACRGPRHCAVQGESLRCDDSVGDVGEPCISEAGDNNFGCSVDTVTEVVCDRETQRFTLSNTCRGGRHCYIKDGKVFCDQSAAREGEVCRPVANHSCAEDATAELQCSPEGTWVKQRDCTRVRCSVHDGQVYCADATTPPAPAPPPGKKAGAAHP